MLMRSLTFVFLSSLVALQMSSAFDAFQEDLPKSGQASGLSVPASTAPPPGVSVLKADAQGHYRAIFKINGKPVMGMVDTGASLVAINESTARRLGYGAVSLDFRFSVTTANGKTEAALVRLKRVEIGSIRIDDVDAFVMRDKALSDTLIGMSFLKRLSGYSAEKQALTMTR
ncbi:MAG TPA: TIGR02281 family clan AA aspartic protease [Rhizobium sp.]|nr:TIGR02281 family clan AA aspartic protease [Rhizobium sp.]